MTTRRLNSPVCIKSLKNQVNIADQCDVAESFVTRLKGLIGKTRLEEGKGLLLRPCNDIHMMFMSIPLDVVFLRSVDLERQIYRVTSVRKNLRPWKLLPVRDSQATVTLEVPVGTVDRCEIQAGDEVCISSL